MAGCWLNGGWLIVWMFGATLSHLSIGMSMFDIQLCWRGDAFILRLVSGIARMGAASTLAFASPFGASAAVQVAMLVDLIWMTVMFLFVVKHQLYPPSETQLELYIPEQEQVGQPGDERLSVAERLERRSSRLSDKLQVHRHRVMRS